MSARVNLKKEGKQVGSACNESVRQNRGSKNAKLQHGQTFRLGGSVGQVTGDMTRFIRITTDTIGKVFDKTEAEAYKKLHEAGMSSFLPQFLGVHEADGRQFLILEDVQYKDKKSSSLFHIQLGFQTCADVAISAEFKRQPRHFVKACVEGLQEKLTDEEIAAGEISEARYLSMVNSLNSTASHGFCLEGVRIGREIFPLGARNKRTSVLRGMLIRSNVSTDQLVKLLGDCQQLRDMLAVSDVFMKHRIYGAALLLMFDNQDNTAKVKMISLRNMLPSTEDFCTHTVSVMELPLAWDAQEDGFLTALDNLIEFFSAIVDDVVHEGCD